MPWESATRISVAPAARAPSIAASTSFVMNPRKRSYSKPWAAELLARHDAGHALHVRRDVDLELRLGGEGRRGRERHEEQREGQETARRDSHPPVAGASVFAVFGIAKRESSIGTLISIFWNSSACVCGTPDADASNECGSIRPPTLR